MSSESEIKTKDVGRHDAYQTISWTYRFTKEEMIKRIDEYDAWYEIFDHVDHPAIDYDNMDDEECMALKMSAIKERREGSRRQAKERRKEARDTPDRRRNVRRKGKLTFFYE